MSSKFINVGIDEAYTIKSLIDLLYNVLNVSIFSFKQESLEICSKNTQGNIMIDIKLDADNFKRYDIPNLDGGEMPIKLTMDHIYKMVKNVKKKDNVSLFIEENDPTQLGIKITSQSKDKKTICYVKIKDIDDEEENMYIEVPPSYSQYKPNVVISSPDFNKMCKLLKGVSKFITISSQKSGIKFEGSTGDIYSTEQIFGKWDKNEEALYSQRFPIKLIMRIAKCYSLHKMMKIYAYKGIPLRIAINVGSLGKCNIYVNDPETL
jgi:DNA polymerase III sliding clamp (beta) subunit (PCNA family)